MSEERAAEGVEHLQAAALEMISAARAFLDVLEEVVTDKTKVATVVEAMGSVAQVAVRTATRAASHAPEEQAGDASRVQRIRVS